MNRQTSAGSGPIPAFYTFGWVLKTPDKGRQVVLDFDFGRAGPKRLGVQRLSRAADVLRAAETLSKAPASVPC